MKCHQRVIREREALVEPRAVEGTLDGATVRQITREQAAGVILRYEWLGTMPNVGQAYYGLFTGAGELAGVACFGLGGGTEAAGFCGAEMKPYIRCLERGACVHWAHPHSGSFLVARACRQAALDHGWRGFFAYSDMEAGEMGTIYQACNWLYLGQAVGRAGYRSRFTDPAGRKLSSRLMRATIKRDGGTTIDREWPDYAAAGWTRDKELGKHKYVTFTGPRKAQAEMRALLKYPTLPYPKRP